MKYITIRNNISDKLFIVVVHEAFSKYISLEATEKNIILVDSGIHDVGTYVLNRKF